MARIFLLAYSIHTLTQVCEKTDENYANKNRIVVLSVNFPPYVSVYKYIYTRVCIYARMYLPALFWIWKCPLASIRKGSPACSFSCLLIYSLWTKLFVFLGSVSCLYLCHQYNLHLEGRVGLINSIFIIKSVKVKVLIIKYKPLIAGWNSKIDCLFINKTSVE